MAPWRQPQVVAHCELLRSSFANWLHRDLLPLDVGGVELSQALYEAPFVLVSHGAQPDPILNALYPPSKARKPAATAGFRYDFDFKPVATWPFSIIP